MKKYKIFTIIITIVGLVAEIINAVLLEMSFYEIETGQKFNIFSLLHNKFFIIVGIILIGQIVLYLVIQHIATKQEEVVDKMIEDAYNDASHKLIQQVVVYSKNGDFESAQNALKLLRKIKKERRKK